MKKKEIFDFFKEQKLPEKYYSLCLRYSDFDNSTKPKKDELLKLAKEHKLNLKYSGRENLMYEDSSYSEGDFRFFISFSHGIIGSTFMPRNSNHSDNDLENLQGYEVRRIVEQLEPDLMKSLNFNYPINTCDNDLKEILDFYLELYKKFKNEFII